MFFSDPNEGETSVSVPGLTTWPTYDTVGQRHIRIQGNVTSLPVGAHFAANRMHFWNSFIPEVLEGCGTCSDCEQTHNDATGGGIISCCLSYEAYFLNFLLAIVTVSQRLEII